MSARRNRHKPIDPNFFNAFSSVASLKKKLLLTPTPSSAKKPKSGLRKIRKTEDRFFWDVEVLPLEPDSPNGASSPLEKSKKELPKIKTKPGKSVNKSVMDEKESSRTETKSRKSVDKSAMDEKESPKTKLNRKKSVNNFVKDQLLPELDCIVEEKDQAEQSQVGVKSRKIIKARRHFRHEEADKLVKATVNERKNSFRRKSLELEEPETVADIQSHKESEVKVNRSSINDISLQSFSNDTDCLGNLENNFDISNKRFVSMGKSRILEENSIAGEKSPYNQSVEKLTQQDEDIKLVVSNSVQQSLQSSIINYEKSLPTITIDGGDSELNSTYNKIIELTLNRTLAENEEIRLVDKSSGVIIIHDSKSIISPSTSSGSMQNGLDFNCSKEDLRPSTSGTIDTSITRRRTFELDHSINNIDLLKSTAEKDSFRMSAPQGEQQEQQSSDDSRFQRVTKRRKWEKVVDSPLVRLSHITPPWGPDDSTPKRTSTPLYTQKSQSLLIKTLSKDPNISNYKPKGKSTSKVKMPNFAAIHEKALQKVENISDYKKRKDDRAKMLLSGKKPIEKFTSSKKQLRFASSTTDKEKSPGFIPLPSTPLPKFKHRQSMDSLNDSAKQCTPPTPLAKKLMRKTIDSPFAITKQEKENKVPLRNGIVKSGNNPFGFNVGMNKITPSLAIPKKKEVGVMSRKIPKLIPKQISSFNSGLLKPMVPKKKDDIKTMITTKTKQDVNTKNKKRSEIKGVRSNRRFELLMNMRKGK